MRTFYNFVQTFIPEWFPIILPNAPYITGASVYCTGFPGADSPARHETRRGHVFDP